MGQGSKTHCPPQQKRNKNRKRHKHREQNSKAQRRPQKKQRGRYIDHKSLSREWRSTFQRTYRIVNTPRRENGLQEITSQEAASKVLRWLKRKSFDPQLKNKAGQQILDFKNIKTKTREMNQAIKQNTIQLASEIKIKLEIGHQQSEQKMWLLYIS